MLFIICTTLAVLVVVATVRWTVAYTPRHRAVTSPPARVRVARLVAALDVNTGPVR